MISRVSKSRQDFQVRLDRCAGLDRTARPWRRPRGCRGRRRSGSSVASAWKVTLYAPASAYGGAHRSGSSIIRWQSIGMSVILSRLSTTGSPSGQVGHEVVVHHVDVQPVGAGHRGGFVGRARRSRRPGSTARSWRSHVAHRSPARAGVCHAVTAHFERSGEHRVGAVPMWPELHVGTVAEIVDRVEMRPGVQRGDRMAAQRVGDDADGLGQMRRTRRVQHHSAGRVSRDRRGKQLALQLGQRRHVAGLTPPAGFWPAPQRTQPGARRVDQHPVERAAESPGSRPSTAQHVDRQVRGRSAPPARRAVRCGSTAVTARPPPASAASIAVLPPGPAHRSSQRPASGPSSSAQCQRQRHQLAALVLHQRRAVTDRLELTGVAAGEVDGVRRVAADGAVDLCGQLARRSARRAGRPDAQAAARRRWPAAHSAARRSRRGRRRTPGRSSADARARTRCARPGRCRRAARALRPRTARRAGRWSATRR